MRIEKINDHQIRCTLSQKDLKDRELRISELAYGTEKAKALFRDMMQQASYEFGFEVDDIPLMIEAIPMLPDALVLVITKVEDPDELDTRFSHFTDDPDDDIFPEEESGFDFVDSLTDEDMLYEDPLLDSDDLEDDGNLETIPFKTEDSSEKEDDFISLTEALGMEPRPKTESSKEQNDLIHVFQFRSLDQLSALGEHLRFQYQGENTLYKNKAEETYYLIMHKGDHTSEEFHKICNTASEYGVSVRHNYACLSYYDEHYEILIRNKALQILASL